MPGRQQQPPVTRLGRGSEFKEIKEHPKLKNEPNLLKLIE